MKEFMEITFVLAAVFIFFAFCRFISFESLFDHDGFIFLCVFHFNELERFHFMIHGDKDS